MNGKTVTIVIPAYNSEKTIAQTIEACLNQEYPQEKLEIIVVDDGSTNDTAEIVRKYPVKYIFQENSGPAKARNTGWKNAQGEIICFTDADCIPPENWISSLVSEYTSEEISGVGGSYEILNPENLLASCIHEEIVSRHLKMAKKGVTHLGSFNLSLRKNVLEKVGGFNEDLKMSEDRDISYRIMEANWKLIFNPGIKVYHTYPTNLIKYLIQQFWRVYWFSNHSLRTPLRVVKDKYIFGTEYFQPFLFLTLLFIGLFYLVYPVFYVYWTLFGLFLLSICVQLPPVIAIISRTKKFKYLALVFINFLRGFAWAIGGISGLVAVVFKKKFNETNKI